MNNNRAQFGPFTTQQVSDAFHAFDLDANGFVGAAELREIYSSIGEEVTDEEIDEMINMVDTDGDGQVSLSEFSKMIFRYAGHADVPDASVTDGSEVTAFNEEYSSDESTGDSRDMVDIPVPQRRHGQLEPLSTHTSVEHSLDPEERKQDLLELVTVMEITELDLHELQKKFIEADDGKYGVVSYEKFIEILELEDTVESQSLFSLFDHEDKGSIKPKEFLLSFANVVNTSKENRIRFAFNTMDASKMGRIGLDELVVILKANYMAVDEQHVMKKAQAIMRQADKEGKGRISYESFLGVCKRFPNLLFPLYNKNAS